MELWLEKLERHSYEPSEEVPVETEVEKELGGGDDDDDDDILEIKNGGSEDSRNNLTSKIEVSYEEPSEVKSDKVEDINVESTVTDTNVKSKIEESALNESVTVDDSVNSKTSQ